MHEGATYTKPMQTVESEIGRPLGDVLHELYVSQGLSLVDVGVELARLAKRDRPISQATVMRWMARHRIERRFPGQRAEALA